MYRLNSGYINVGINRFSIATFSFRVSLLRIITEENGSSGVVRFKKIVSVTPAPVNLKILDDIIHQSLSLALTT